MADDIGANLVYFNFGPESKTQIDETYGKKNPHTDMDYGSRHIFSSLFTKL